MTKPIEIRPDLYYDDVTARQILGLPANTMARARRDGALRFSRRGRKIIYRGEWLLLWLDGDSDRRLIEGLAASAEQQVLAPLQYR